MGIGFLKREHILGMKVRCLVLAGLLLISARPAIAQQDEKPKVLPPLVVINAAGVDRLLGDVNFMFDTIGRDDVSEALKSFLGNLGNLKGLDRNKSLGMMLYFKPGLTPGVEPVGFVPVDNIGDLVKTLQLDGIGAKIKKVPGEENRYDIEDVPSINGRRYTLHVNLQGGYAYLSNNVEAFDRDLPNPGPLTQSLAGRYDLAASLNVEGIPEAMRTVFLDFFRAQVHADLQQRDDEPEAAYRARKAGGMNNLKNIEAIVKDGQSITLGIDASQETKAIVVELEVKAKPSSGFAKQLKNFPGKPSVFANAYSEQIPLAATGSWNLSKDDQNVFRELVRALDAKVTEGMKNQNLDPAPLEGIVKSLQSTVKTGAMDFFLQFVGEPSGKFSLVGGLKIDRSGDFAAGLQGVLQQLAKDPHVAELKIDAEKHNGVALHRILGKGDGGQENERIYGGMPAFYIGAGRGAVWFGLGKEGTADRLKQAMTLVETLPAEPLTPDRIAPFQVVLNLTSWVALRGEEESIARSKLGPPGDEKKDARQRARRGPVLRRTGKPVGPPRKRHSSRITTAC